MVSRNRIAVSGETADARTTQAIELGKKIKEFAIAPLAEKESAIAALVEYVKENATAEVLTRIIELNGNTDFHNRLKNASKEASETPLATKIGDIWGWGVGRAVVAIEKDGTILGFDVSKGKEDKIHYTVSKALCVMLLDASGYNTDLSLSVESVGYLETLGLKMGVNLFLGGIKPTKVGDKTVYFAGGSCALNKAIVEDLVGRERKDLYEWAGVAETLIAEITSVRMSEPQLDKNKPYKSAMLEELYGMPKKVLEEKSPFFS